MKSVLSNIDYGAGGVYYTKSTNTIVLVNESTAAIVPTGMKYELVVMTSKNGTYYYYETSGTTYMNMTTKANMSPQNKASLITLLDGL